MVCAAEGVAPGTSVIINHSFIHHQMNDIIWRAIKRAQIPAAKEPVSLMQQDGKRHHTATYSESHMDQTAREACLAANKAAANKIAR